MALTPERFSLHPGRDFPALVNLILRRPSRSLLVMESGRMNHELFKFFHHSLDTSSASAFSGSVPR